MFSLCTDAVSREFAECTFLQSDFEDASRYMSATGTLVFYDAVDVLTPRHILVCGVPHSPLKVLYCSLTSPLFCSVPFGSTRRVLAHAAVSDGDERVLVAVISTAEISSGFQVDFALARRCFQLF